MNEENINQVTLSNEVTNGAKSKLVKFWEYVIENYGIPFGQYCIKVFYGIYTHFTFFNMMLCLIKCIPTVVFTHRYIKNIYVTSQERMKLKQLELEDLQLQIQIVQTKLSVRDAEFAERGELLKRKANNLRNIRARVREIIAGDEELRNALNGNPLWDDNTFSNTNTTYEGVSSESKIIMELLRDLKCDQVMIPALDPEMLSCGEPSRDAASAENSVYSSAADADGKQDCHVKIIKVTNVYKVAYLRHFIKQKRLRRANRQALLRKKMDNIKKLLDDWQKTLSMVINSKLSLLNSTPQVELASHEAMGDCSKPNLYNASDSDSDFINSTDNFHDNYSVSWSPNQYSPIYAYNNYDEFAGGTTVAREYYDVRDYEKYKCQDELHECNRTGTGVLYMVPEETNSQLEIKEIQSDAE